MSKLNNKKIITYIKKYAEQFYGVTNTPESKPPVVPSNPSYSTTDSSSTSTMPWVENRNKAIKKTVSISNIIKDMQKAIQEFVSQTTSYKSNPQNVPDKRKDFNDFLSNQYPTKLHSEDEPSKIIQLNQVLDNLHKNVSGKFADGIWGKQTNSALKNIFAFAQSMIRSANDFGSNISGFNKNDLIKMLRTLKSVKLNKTPIKELEEKADILKPLIEKLTEYYIKYSKFVLDHPEYKQYLDKESPLFKVGPAESDSTTVPEDLKPYENKLNDLILNNVPIPNAQGSITSIAKFPLSYLKDMNGLYSLMMSKEVGFTKEDITNSYLVSKVLNEISNYVKSLKAMPQG